LGILRRALQQGVKWEWISTNPATMASTPRVRPFRVEPPNPEAVMRLINEAAKEDPDFACLLTVAATTGARRGELCALRWSAIDFDDQSLTIAGAVVEGVRSKLYEKDTKTHGSRKIAIDEFTPSELDQQRERCEKRTAELGVLLSLPVPIDDSTPRSQPGSFCQLAQTRGVREEQVWEPLVDGRG
jgi:integrase